MNAREFDAKDEATEPDPGSNPSDDQDAAVLEDHEDDPVVEELTSLINSLSQDEQIDLVALAWLGREDYTTNHWPAVREEAERAHNNRAADYLLGMPPPQRLSRGGSFDARLFRRGFRNWAAVSKPMPPSGSTNFEPQAVSRCRSRMGQRRHPQCPASK